MHNAKHMQKKKNVREMLYRKREGVVTLAAVFLDFGSDLAVPGFCRLKKDNRMKKVKNKIHDTKGTIDGKLHWCPK